MSNLESLKPILQLLPEVEMSDRKLHFRDRASWTIMALLVFLVLSHIPVFGVPRDLPADPFYHMRLMMASGRGSLLELGIAPILTAAVAFHLLISTRVIKVNYTLREERALAQGAQMLLSVTLSLVMAILYVFSGMYTGVALSGLSALLVVFQLFSASVLVTWFDQMMQKGYGVGSGVSLFTCCAVCTDLINRVVGFSSVQTSSGGQAPGVLISIPQLLVSRGNKFGALYDIFFRSESGLNGLVALVVTLAVAGAVVYLQSFRVEVLVKYQKYRAQAGKYPIKLFYTGNMPLVFLSVLVGNIYFYSQVFFALAPTSVLSELFGVWSYANGETAPARGLAYYLSAPQSVVATLLDPFHTAFYVLFILSFSAVLAKAWVEIAGISSKGVARELKDNQMVIKGHRDTALEHELNRYIPTAAAFGGMAMGALVVLCDLIGIAGFGFGLVTSIVIIFQYYETVSREYGGSLAQLLGELS